MLPLNCINDIPKCELDHERSENDDTFTTEIDLTVEMNNIKSRAWTISCVKVAMNFQLVSFVFQHFSLSDSLYNIICSCLNFHDIRDLYWEALLNELDPTICVYLFHLPERDRVTILLGKRMGPNVICHQDTEELILALSAQY